MEPRQTANLEGRIALSNVGGYTMAANPATALPMALAAPILYSESGVKMMSALMRERPEVARRIGEQLTKRATKEGSISAAQVMEEYKRQTRAQE
jgi:predicted polyphosphate/ATP-dependent NAD kinase